MPYAAFFAPFLLVKYAIEDRLPGRAGSVARPLVYALWSAGLIALGLTLAPETLGEFWRLAVLADPARVLLCYLWNAILTSLIMGFGPQDAALDDLKGGTDAPARGDPAGPGCHPWHRRSLYQNSNYNLLTQPRSRGEMAQWFLAHDAQHPIWVAEAGAYRGLGQPIALSQYPGYAGSVEYSIYHLHPGYLGRGGGHPADRADAHPAKELGYTCVVSLITASNQPSIRLHQRMGFELVGRMRQVASKFGQSVDVVTYQYFVGQPGTEQIARLTEQARRAGVRIPLGQGQLRYDGRQRLVCAYKCPNHAACGRVEPGPWRVIAGRCYCAAIPSRFGRCLET